MKKYSDELIAKTMAEQSRTRSQRVSRGVRKFISKRIGAALREISGAQFRFSGVDRKDAEKYSDKLSD